MQIPCIPVGHNNSPLEASLGNMDTSSVDQREPGGYMEIQITALKIQHKIGGINNQFPIASLLYPVSLKSKIKIKPIY